MTQHPVAARLLYVMCVACMVLVGAYVLAERAIEQRTTDNAQAIARASAQALRPMMAVLDDIPSGTFASCDPVFILALQRVAREHPGAAGVFVQGAGDGRQFCTDEGPVTVPESMVAPRPDAGGVTVGAWVGLATAPDLLYFSRRGPAGVRAVLVRPLDFLFLASPECAVCRRGHFELDSGPVPIFEIGPATLSGGTPVVARARLPGLSLSYVLSESRSAVWTQLRQWAWVAALIVVLAVALLEVALRYRSLKQNSLSSLMQAAVARRQFLPHYQPIVDAASGCVAGCEVLIRWRQSDGTMIAPSQFIEALESTGHVVQATQAMIEATLDDLTPVWKEDPHFFASVNVVPAHLESGQLGSYLDALQARRAYAAAWFAFEVTERLPFTDLDRANAEIARMRAQGFRFELDDVGTGYGGFSYLQRLGFDAIKLDKMFVDTIGSDDPKLSLVSAIVGFAHNAGLEIIAEGVERTEQVQYLQSLGVRLMQGYYFARPMPAAEFVHFMRSRARPGEDRAMPFVSSLRRNVQTRS